MGVDDQIRSAENRLAALEKERIDLLGELRNLRAQRDEQKPMLLLGRPPLMKTPETNEEKADLFLTLFRGRENVYPKRWENLKTGRSGYSPVCENEWVKPICQKPTIKCSDCSHQKFSPLSALAIGAHLRGATTIGTYAIREDDTCPFLACDFDESSWQTDLLAFCETAKSFGIDVAMERSRSGNGGHAWIFFAEPVPARLARSLGTLIIAKCSERNIRLSLESYDRFFPTQDFLPKGGFGNLIALPLQKIPRENGNSCFVDESFVAISDQWAYLSSVRRLYKYEVDLLLKEYLPKGNFKRADAFEDVAWLTDNEILDKTSIAQEHDRSLEGKNVEITFGPMLSIPVEGLPTKVIARLKKTSSFANPEFYKLQRIRLQTYPNPRFIFSGEMRPDHLLLPRGVLDKVTKILQEVGASVVIRDERIAKKKITVDFEGTLTPIQEKAVNKITESDLGILMAPPGAGKTVMACKLIAERKVSTLILVHRQPLLEQWKERISSFLKIPVKEIGTLSGAKKKMTGKIDVGMLQSISRLEDLSVIAEKYSQIIIDECHHVPATSFEAILKQLHARFVLGLSATPYRKDGLEKIMFLQCGPIRHEIQPAEVSALPKEVSIYETSLVFPDELGRQPPYHVLIHHLVQNESRNHLITTKVAEVLEQNRFPLLVSDRKDHLDLLEQLIKKMSPDVELVVLEGTLTNKQRRGALARIAELRFTKMKVMLLATASLIGEGFDLQALDTLIFATPLSFEGRLIQYAGRIHRESETKKSAQIIDFVDSYSGMFLKMYRSRVSTYRKMGYRIHEDERLIGPLALYSRSRPPLLSP
ncbi:MAG TPA: DEAD/DEAH box helicase family protein [Pseudobdellovibrionaceae bacterium]